MNHCHQAAAVLLAVVLAACSAEPPPQEQQDAGVQSMPQQGVASGGPSASEISNYELTMNGIRRWMTASGNLARAARTNSAIAEAPDAENASMAELIAWYERTPGAREALRSAGITPRDYVMTTMAYLQAGMTAAVLESSKDAQAPPGQNMRNVEFVRQNRAELERLAREMGMDRPGSDDDS